MILKFREHATEHVESTTCSGAVKQYVCGLRWTVYGEVSEVEYGDGDRFIVEEGQLGSSGPFGAVLIGNSHRDDEGDPMHAEKVIHDREMPECPVFSLVWFRQNGEQKVVATQMQVYLCNDRGDTVESIYGRD